MAGLVFDSEHDLFRQSLQDFVQTEIIPNVDVWEEEGRIPRDVYKKLGDMGFFGIGFDEKYGGLETDFFYRIILIEELNKCYSGGTAAALLGHSLLALEHIQEQGSKRLKEIYLKPGISGDKIGCLAITEPHAGSDVAALLTKANKEGDYYIVNGSKTFITNGVYSDFIVAAVRTGEPGYGGISMLVIDRNTDGVSATPLKKLGWHASDTGEIAFDNVKVPIENLIGEENQGFYYIMQRFELERMVLAIGAISACDQSMEYALQYMSERKAFGRSINKFQELRHRIAQMASEIESCRSFNYAICQAYSKGEDVTDACAMAKMLCTELSDRVSYNCLQFLGGYGYMEEYKMARLFRDSRLGPIGGGTSEIMREIIAKKIIGKNKINGMSNYYFTEDHEIFRQGLKDFLNKEVVPNIEKWEEEQRIPKDIFLKMGEMGYLGLNYPVKYGGMDADFWFSVVFIEEISKVFSGGFMAAFAVQQYMSSPYLFKHGSDFIKEKYLTKAITGEAICSIAISEPNAGSDVANISTTALREGDYYVVNGSKTFITSGVYGDVLITVVKTKPDAGFDGISLLVIDRNAEGVTATKLKKLGWHASDTAELAFDNVKVPVENLLGDENQGFFYLMGGLQLERLAGAIGGYAGSESALEYSLQYMSEREAFGRPINKFQVLRHRVAQMSSEIECIKHFVYHCCRLHADGEYAVKECSMAKLMGTELSDKVMYQCLQFFGGYGYMEEYKMARMFRDSRIGTIGGGTSEIMREIIAKMVIDDKSYSQAGATITTNKITKEKESIKPSQNGHKVETIIDKPKNENVMSYESVLSALTERAAIASPLGSVLKLNFGDSQIVIDGTSEANSVSGDDTEANCTVDVTLDDFTSMMKGDLNPMNAFMSGKMKIKGDMGVAMKLQTIMS